jgi:thiamine-phosphate pyrophosphorylase
VNHARDLPHTAEARARLAQARLMLLFTPESCAGRDPLAVLASTLDAVDVIQVRPKAHGSNAPGAARDTYDWCVKVAALLETHGRSGIPVLVNDRVDVAEALLGRGCAGVHLGQDDCLVGVARRRLGPAPLIGLSTHDAIQVAEAGEEPVDYLGFGPIHGTPTKGYARGLGVEAAWIASAGSSVPVFAIGGIDATNAADLARIGRVAVGSAILSAADPGRAAREIRALLDA